VLISTLADGPIRYSDLGHAIPGVSQRMLTLTLKHLHRAGLVIRTSYPEVPVSPPSTVSCLRSDS
jgi:DNA-binding HxlR family transcriptional regulator